MRIVPPGSNHRNLSRRFHEILLSRRRRLVTVLALILLTGCCYIFLPSIQPRTKRKATSIFRGQQYWKEGVTQSVQTLYETPFARFQIHKVQLQPTGPIIDDWLWFDEADNVNILVQDEAEGKFWILEQTKYAFGGTNGDDETSYAVVGGLIEPTDGSPLEAAQRELREELKLESRDWVSLGNYVAAANRGGGTTHVFWAKKARPLPGSSNQQQRDENISEGELEPQDRIKLSRSELLKALEAGKFREIKWTATVALALLRDESCS